MNEEGHVLACGTISSYNEKDQLKVTSTHFPVIARRLTIHGLFVISYGNRWMEGIEQTLKWIKEGKLKYMETVTEGFENISKAFIGIFEKKKLGKSVVKIK